MRLRSGHRNAHGWSAGLHALQVANLVEVVNQQIAAKVVRHVATHDQLVVMRQRILVLVHHVQLRIVASIAAAAAGACIHERVIGIQALRLLVNAQLHELKRRLRVNEEGWLQLEHI